MVERRARTTIGALVVVALVAVLVVRFVVHDEAAQRVASDGALAKPVYAPSLVSKSIRALSSGADAVLAVGDDGVILRHRADADWTADTSPTHAVLRAVAQQLDEAVAVGDNGTIVELAFSHWTIAASPTNRALRSIVFTSYGAVAVGDGGTIVRRTGPREPWHLEPSPTTNDLRGACSGLRDVWVVGAAGTMVFRTPLGWQQAPPLTSAALRAVSCDDHAAIAVGDGGAMLERLDDVGWHASASGVTSDLLAVSASIGTRSFLAAGSAGVLIRIARNASIEPSGFDWEVRAVTEGPLGTWLGGERGIARRTPL